MKTKTLLFCAAAAAAVSALTLSCNKSRDASSEQSPYVRVESSVEGQAPTKSMVSDASALSGVIFYYYESATGGLTSVSALTPPDATHTRENCARATTPGVINFSAAIPYDKVTDKFIYLVGLSPDAAAKTSDATNNTWTIDGKHDFLITDVWNAGKMSDNPHITTGMKFKHVLANLQVICKNGADALAATQSAWGNITKIELLASTNKIVAPVAFLGDLTITNNTFAFPLLQGDYSAALASTPIPASTSSVVTAAAMVPAQDASSIKLKVYSEKVTAGKELTINLTANGSITKFDAGCTHTVTLTFSASTVNVDVTTSTVDAWKSGTTGNQDVVNP